jgi:phage terminase large subunit-like protein
MATSPRVAHWDPLPHQIPPTGEWDTWVILAGRGSGKTRAGTQYVLDHLMKMGPNARVGVGAPTTADARDVCAEGASGLMTVGRQFFTAYNRSLGEARHIGGGYVKFMGAEEPARWNGPQWSLLWADELALWNRESWEQAQFGLRLGEHPRAIVTTTPKARKFVRELAQLPTTIVRTASTMDNPYLSENVLRRLQDRYGGTRLGRQELLAEWLDDTPGALWTRDLLDQYRVNRAPEMLRIVVAIDPSGGSEEGHAECGIVVAGKGIDGHAYVLGDGSARLSPQRWARKAVGLYREHRADRIVAERNFGGEMVRATIQTVDESVPVLLVNASRSKRIRAEPVAALDEQGRVHHVGMLPALEDQLCSWIPDSGDVSPDRLDARVWALTNLMLSDIEVKFY